MLNMIQILIKIVKLCELNKLAYEDLSCHSKPAPLLERLFGLVCNVESLEFSKVNCKIAWDRLKSVQHILPCLC